MTNDPPRHHTTVRLDDETYDALCKVSKDLDRSRHYLMVKWIKEGIKREGAGEADD